MNVKQILPVAVMAIATLTGCEGKKEMNAGIRPENMDLTAQKGADFYVNGKRSHPSSSATNPPFLPETGTLLSLRDISPNRGISCLRRHTT